MDVHPSIPNRSYTAAPGVGIDTVRSDCPLPARGGYQRAVRILLVIRSCVIATSRLSRARSHARRKLHVGMPLSAERRHAAIAMASAAMLTAKSDPSPTRSARS